MPPTPDSNAPKRITIPVPPDRVAKDPDKLRWGTVSTIRAPLHEIARFAAWHLDLGAARMHIFLDQPAPETKAFFAPFPQVVVFDCTPEYWAGKPDKARTTHQLRQIANASHCYHGSDLDWLAHIDVDEFLLPVRPIAHLLAEVPKDAALARLQPAEMLAQPNPWSGPTHFKLTRREAGHSQSILHRIYPEFGEFLSQGFISYSVNKIFARVGLPRIRFGIHALLRNGAVVDNGYVLPDANIGHAHAPSWEMFQRKYQFRMEFGSYRKKKQDTMELADIFDLMRAEEGEQGIRRFFDELSQATPELLSRLRAHDMLLTRTLDLDEKVARWFGDLPAPQGDQS